MDAPSPVLVDPSGRPLRRAATPQPVSCPQCRGTKRVASGGFGAPWPVCATCGFEWHGEPFVNEEQH